MNIEFFENPLPHIIIRNIFDDDNLKSVWKELDFLTDSNKLLPPEQSRSAKKFGVVLKKNHAVYLEEVYRSARFSNIFNAVQSSMSKKIIQELISKHPVFGWFKNINKESMLVSYYENDDRYLPHEDSSVYTILINFYKEPKAFTGGDLTLGNTGHTIPLENNRMIIIPSWATHGVTPVKFTDEDTPMSGMGRYTISIFSFVEDRLPPEEIK